jgi:type II secretory pathway pseudopilin PulG
VVVGLLRNGGLLVCLAALSGRSGDEGTRTPGASPTTSADQTTDNPSAGIATHAQGLRAFTLVEVLVCVLIVLALFSLLFPALRNSRDEARAVRDLTQTRSIFIATQAYAADHQDVLPSFAPAGRLRGPKPLLGQEVEVAYFTGQARMYINLLVPTYCSDVSGLSADTPESNVGIGLPPNAIRSSVQMTYTAFAQPAYFVGQQAPADAAPLLRAARLGQVAHPSAKGLLLDLRPAERAQLRDPERKHTVQPWGIAWADGSATQRTVDLLLGYRTVTRPAAMFDWPVLATEGGVAGRDFELAGSALP